MENKALTQEELNNIPKNALVQMYLQLASSFELISNQLESLQKQNQSLVKTMDSLQEKIDLLTQARFGRKTEKLSEITADQIGMDLSNMLDIFNEIEALTENGTPLEPEMEKPMSISTIYWSRFSSIRMMPPADYMDDLVPWSDKLPDSCRKIK